MDELVIDILKEKPVNIPKILLRNYKKINIDEKELIVLICLIGIGDKIPYNPTIFEKELGMDKFECMQLLNNLSEKNLINIKVENNKSGKKQEYIYLDFLYSKLLNIIIEGSPTDTSQATGNDIFSLFESELGRTISPMEVEIIKEWLNDGFTEEIIKEALKEAIYNDARSLKYVDRILFNWKVKGIKTKNDIIKDKKKFKKNNRPIEPLYDYNWLEDESNE